MTEPAGTTQAPMTGLLGRYRAVFGAAWSARHALAGPQRLADEAAFLPAALSLQETPVHPAPRRAAFVLCALFAAAVVWAVFGQIDIVAVAPGRIVVSDNTKIVQPLEAGVVRRVLVRDGDSVKAGQLLVELDATQAAADGASVQEQLNTAMSEVQRTAALTQALESGRAPVLPGPAQEANARDQTQLHAEWAEIGAKLARLAAESARREAEAATVQQGINKLEATLPIARQREADFDSLTQQGFMSGHMGQDRRRERIEMESDLAMQRARLKEVQSAVHEAAQTRAAVLAEVRRGLSERHALASSKWTQLNQERSKTEQRSRLAQLTAPVDGTVQQVAVHTEGGVVTPAQVLMVIVPKDAQIWAEVVVDNKDIGFVYAGQDVEIKLEPFPFTRYGTVAATVKSIVSDAVIDEEKGAVFPAKVAMRTPSIEVDGKVLQLTPGMNMVAEIKTGRRTIMEFLTSPIHKASHQGLRER